jgi:uncharacterized membrane protein
VSRFAKERPEGFFDSVVIIAIIVLDLKAPADDG